MSFLIRMQSPLKSLFFFFFSSIQKRLIELGELVGVEENGVGAVEARLKRDLDKMVREKQALLDDIKVGDRYL